MMKKLRLFALLTALVSMPTLLDAAPFQNGDFEAGTTGWTAAGAGVTLGGTGQGKTTGARQTSFNGGGATAGGTISQTFDTVIGQTYNLQFDFAGWGNADDTHMLNATVTGGGTVLNQTVSGRTGTGVSTPNAWDRHNFRFTANSTSSTLTFTDVTAVPASSSDGNLDTVSVTAVNPSIDPGGTGGFGTVNFQSGNLTQIAGATASQSSTGSGGVASRGIDGNTNGSYGSGTITHTNDSNGFWQVDLDPGTLPGDPSQTYAIDQVVIFNRGDCCEARLVEFDVNVLNSDPGTTDDLNTFDVGTPNNGNNTASGISSNNGGQSHGRQGLGINFAPNTIGDVVRVNQNSTPVLSLAEVQAFGLADFNLAANEVLNLEISADGQDFVNVEGDAILDGVLNVSFIDGFEPGNGDVFDLIDAATIDFSNLTVNANVGLFELRTVAGGNNGTLLQLAVTPEPSTIAIWTIVGLMMAGFVTVRQRRKRRA